MADSTVAALAGRRIDSDSSSLERFPLRNVGLVQQRIRNALLKNRVDHLVCSAACGADLVALAEAAMLGLKRTVILPYPAISFRQTSVVDRPGAWGDLFDQIISEVDSIGELVTLDKQPGAADAYEAVTRTIIETALREQTVARPIALVVWEGGSHGPDDLTALFKRTAETHGFLVIDIQTT